jgi:holo-[acyl-carrier protein] synthase
VFLPAAYRRFTFRLPPLNCRSFDIPSFPNLFGCAYLMIVGLGTDLMDVARIAEKLRDDPGFSGELFTSAEIRYCEGKHSPAPHFAARFAAKEAFLKALGTGWRDGLSWREIEIGRDDFGRPLIALSGKAKELVRERNVARIHVTLTHTATQAAATVILES